MSEIAVAIITGIFAVIVVVLTARLNGKLSRVEEATKATKAQVVNGHQTNLREEADERHLENTEKLDELLGYTARIFEILERHTFRLGELEKTQPQKRRTK